MKYTIEKGVSGVYRVRYQCEKCGGSMESPLVDAGKRGPCPNCSVELVIPGSTELKQQQRAEAERQHKNREEQELKERNEPALADAVRHAEEIQQKRRFARAQRERNFPNIVTHAKNVRRGAAIIKALGVFYIVVAFFTCGACWAIAITQEISYFWLQGVIVCVVGILIGVLLIALASFAHMIADTCEMAREYVVGKQEHPTGAGKPAK